jgi:radical SAM protein with 4Fe4S-binding SPASM domain
MKTKLPHIAFELTDACNLKCEYCYNIWKIPGAEHKPFNSYDKAMQTLKRIFKQAEVKSVAFTGGEPFLAKRLLELALFCRMENKSVTMISNGSLGKKEEYKLLLKMGVRLFEFPIHSANPLIHNTITKVDGSWERSLNSTRQVTELGGYVVPVIVITTQNVECIGDTLDFIHSLGLNRIMMNRYNIGGNGVKNPEAISASPDQLRKAFKIAEQKSIDLGLVITSNVCSPICLLNPEDYPHIGFGHCSEDVRHKPITIDINGNVRVCNHSPIVAGNIYKKTLEEILFSDYVESWKETIPEDCIECNWWKKCRGGCRAASEQTVKGLSHIDPVMTIFRNE